VNDLVVRRATDADLPALLALLRASMGRADDPRFDALFRWKHLDNAFGPSPMWVVCAGDEIVGLRVFMRWEFVRAGSGPNAQPAVLRAIRAVDTATHPDFQGKGIFTKLTLGGIEELATEGVDFVFNTPNDNSRPGYLKMGWHVLGRPAAAIRPTRLAALPKLRGARTAASHWSEPITAGTPALEAIDRCVSHAENIGLTGAPRRSGVLRTRLDADVLRWRFGLPELHYRAVGDERGLAFVRVRRRGDAREGAVALVLAPDRTAQAGVLREVRRALRSEADYLLALGATPGFIPVKRLGPLVTARTVASAPPATIADLDLNLADIELF
jgi:hypothetical protein